MFFFTSTAVISLPSVDALIINFLFRAKKESCKEKLPSPLAFYFAKKRAPYTKNLNLQLVTAFLSASNRQIFLTLNAASFFASRFASSTQNTMRRHSWV